MNTIIAPTDFSQGSLNAVNYAADMAVDLKADLLLLHIVEVPATAIAEFPVTEISYHQVSRENELKNLKAQLLERTGNAICIHTTELLGNVNYEIKATCELVKPFAVVMNTHAPGKLERLLFGSVTAYSSQHLHVPVINVPANASYKAVNKIAFACDFKDIEHLPADEIKAIAKAFNASIAIFHFNTATEDAAGVEVEKQLLLHALKDFAPAMYAVSGNSVETSLEIFAKEASVDMVLVVPRRHGLFHKSQSQQVIFHLPIPAISIHEN